MAAVDRTVTASPVTISPPPASRVGSYETTSGSSSSTVPGPGALSGKAIKALGRVTIRGIDHFVILRQLSVITQRFPLPDKKAAFVKHVEEIYANALEFSRQGLYREEVNRKAMTLLLGQIGMSETQYLVRALSGWDHLELRLFLSDILIQLAPLWNPCLGKVFASPLLGAYSETDTSGHISMIPFLLFISKLIRTRGSVCRAVLDVGFLDVLILVRSLNDLNKKDIISELESNEGRTFHRKRLLAASNAVLLDIISYPDLRHIVLHHPICSTWATPKIPTAEIAPFTSREKSLFLTSERDIPDDDSLLYLTLDLPAVAKLGCVSEIDIKVLINSLTFGVEYDQALRVFLLRSRYNKKVALFSGMIQYMLEQSSSPTTSSPKPSIHPWPDTLRSRYRLLFFLRLITAAAWGPSNRAALLDAGVIDFLVQTVQTEIPDSYIAIMAPHAHEDHSIPAIIREQGLAHLLGGALAKTSRLVGLISTAFSALFPEDVEPDSPRK
ncbi:hypothetical protein B0H19DRAFT_544231 [Mycena capillaripes]|nr:hypothetical protein B0H19DRAFT_544231 [Mycena capillaripes]